MPTPFNISDGSSGGNNNNNGYNSHTSHSSSNQAFNVEIDRDDPSNLFTDLTEIGHGNFGAVYYVTHQFLKQLYLFN